MVEKAGAVRLLPVENLSEDEAGLLSRLVAMVPLVKVAELCRTPPEPLVDRFPEIATDANCLNMLGHQSPLTIASPSATGGYALGEAIGDAGQRVRPLPRDRKLTAFTPSTLERS